MTWPDLITYFRIRKGWTVKETVYHTGVDHQTLYGKRVTHGPSLKKAIQIMRVLEIPMQQLEEVTFAESKGRRRKPTFILQRKNGIETQVERRDRSDAERIRQTQDSAN